MNKRYIFLTILAFASLTNARPRPQTHENSAAPGYNKLERGSAIAATLYRTITPTRLKNGLIIDRPGSYVFVTATTIDSTSTQEDGTINGATQSAQGVIVIKSDNVTLNMNGTSLKSNNAGMTAIFVDDSFKNVTIENGSILNGGANWDQAITVGYNCSNIVIRDMNVSGVANSTASQGAINILGTSGNTVNNVTLENVELLGAANSGSAGSGIQCNYVNSLNLLNVRSNGASTAVNYDAIALSNCNNVVGKDVQADHNVTTGAATLKCYNFTSCTDVLIEDLSASSNTSAADCDGMYFSGSNNVTLNNASADNNTGTVITGFNFANAATNATLNNVSSSRNGTSGAPTTVTGLLMVSIDNVQGNNLQFNNNTGTTAMNAMNLTTCNDVNLSNVLASNNAATAPGVDGVLLNGCKNVVIDRFEANNSSTMKSGIRTVTAANNNLTIINSSISNCSSGSAGFVGLDFALGDLNVTVRNCSLANNTGTTTFDGVKASSTVKNLVLDNAQIVNNTATAGDMNGINLAAAQGVIIANCEVSHNDSAEASNARNSRGLYAQSSVTNLAVSNSNFSFNSVNSSNTDTSGSVAGVWVSTVNGVQLVNCNAHNNTGTGCAYGFYLTASNNAGIKGCHANMNAAQTKTGATTDVKGIEALPSAGFYLVNCDYCRVEDCSAKSNLAGNYALFGDTTPNPQATDVINVTNSCSGFGFVNVGTSNAARNVGNVFANCEAHGNGTQLDTTITVALGTAAFIDTGTDTPGKERYWMSDAVAGGFIDQWGQGTLFDNCTANNNGLQDNLISYGFLTANAVASTNQSVSANVNQCSASNNWFFGFCDDGAQQGTRVNSETTYTGCYAAMNGQQNSNATGQDFVPAGGVASEADGHVRNYYMHFTDNGQYSPVKLVSYGNQDFSQIPGNRFFNVSLTFEA